MRGEPFPRAPRSARSVAAGDALFRRRCLIVAGKILSLVSPLWTRTLDLMSEKMHSRPLFVLGITRSLLNFSFTVLGLDSFTAGSHHKFAALPVWGSVLMLRCMLCFFYGAVTVSCTCHPLGFCLISLPTKLILCRNT